MQKNYRLAPFIGISILSTSSVSMANEMQKLDELVVTATGYEQTVSEAPASITVINQEEINQGAYKNISEVLSHTPGIFALGGASGNDISIRGMPTKYTLLLVDGRPQSSRESQPNGGGGMDQEWLPPLKSIERIEVIRGPMSTLYGANAMGGVINIITRKATDEWHGNVRIESTTADSNDFGTNKQGSIYLAGPVVEDLLSLRLGARGLFVDEDDIARGASEKEIHNYNAQLSYAANKRHNFDFDVMKSDQKRMTTLGKSAAASARSNSETNNKKTSTALTHTGNWGDVSDVTYVQRESTYNEGRDIRITNVVADSRWIVPFDDGVTTLGANLKKEKLTDFESASDDTVISNDQYSIYGENEWFAVDPLSITSGLRVDKNENFSSHVSPRLYLNWFMTEDLTLKAGVATGYQAPELRDMAENWIQESRGGDIYGNPDLKPETSLSKELGVIFSRPNYSLGVMLFDNRFDDKIMLTDCPSSICSDSSARYNVNVDKAKTQGVELTAEFDMTSYVGVDATYTYTDSKQLSGDNEGQPLTQIPMHLLAARLNWLALDKFKLWLDYEYHGQESQATGLSSNTETRAPSYHLVHIGGQYELNDNFVLQAGVNNLRNEEFTFDEYGFVATGRAYWGALEYSF